MYLLEEILWLNIVVVQVILLRTERKRLKPVKKADNIVVVILKTIRKEHRKRVRKVVSKVIEVRQIKNNPL